MKLLNYKITIVNDREVIESHQRYNITLPLCEMAKPNISERRNIFPRLASFDLHLLPNSTSSVLSTNTR